MNKIFLLYLLCVSASLLFLSAYFSLAFFEYIESVFYIISMILVSSTLFIFFLSNKQFLLSARLILISFFFLLMNISLILIKNLFVLNTFTVSIFSIFEQFSFLAFGCFLLIFSHSLNKSLKTGILILLFSPMILFSTFLLFLTYQNIPSNLPINYFMIFFAIIYDFLIVSNFYKAYKDSVELKLKSSMILLGLMLIFSFLGFKEAGLFLFISSIFVAAGSFILCFGVLVEKDLGFYSIIFNKIASSLPANLKGKFISWVIKVSSKMDGLSMIYLKSKIILVDNPAISNNDETKKYDELLVYSISWMKRNWKASANSIKFIKKYYNDQKFLTKKLSQFSL